MQASGEHQPPRSPNRRLGRGLQSLLSVPIEPATGQTPAVSARSAAPDSIAAVAPGSDLADAALRRPEESRSTALAAALAGPQAGATSPQHVEARIGTRSLDGDSASSGGDGRSTTFVASRTAVEADRDRLELITVDDIRPNRRQPRRDFNEQSLATLASSIRQSGVMQPIILRPAPRGADESGDAPRYELVAGERRWRAAKLVGLDRVPAVVRDLDDRSAAEWALIENVQREDLNPIERSDALRRLIADFGLTHQELAERVGLERSSVTNLLRLGELDPFTRDAVQTGRLGQGHAKALLGVDDTAGRRQLAAAAIAGDWSVRELERRVQATVARDRLAPLASVSTPPTAPSAHVVDLERRLSEHVGSRVRIQLGRKKGTGRLVLDFFTLDQFDGLLAKLGFDQRD